MFHDDDVMIKHSTDSTVRYCACHFYLNSVIVLVHLISDTLQQCEDKEKNEWNTIPNILWLADILSFKQPMIM